MTGQEILSGMSFRKNVVPGAVTYVAAQALGLGALAIPLAGLSPAIVEIKNGASPQTALTSFSNDKVAAMATNYMTAMTIETRGIQPFGFGIGL